MAEVQPIMRRSDYLNAIEDKVNDKRRFMDMMTRRDAITREVGELRQRAQEWLERADRMEAELADAKALYLKADKDIVELRTGLVLCEQDSKIKQIDKLADQLAQLDPEALAKVMAQLEKAAAAQNGGA
jgi:flagellar motility protein MotE (MotC chaperone)